MTATPEASSIPTEVTLDIDADTFDMGDLEDFEDYVGKSLFDCIGTDTVRDPETGAKIQRERRMPTKGQTALIWLTVRRTTPGFTVEQARKVKPAAIKASKGTDTDPTVTAS